MRTGLHHTGVELEGREGEAGFESPIEAGFDSPTIMVPITLLSKSSSQVSFCAVWIKIRKRGGASTEPSRLAPWFKNACVCSLAENLEASPGPSKEKWRVNKALIRETRIDGSS